MTEDEPLGVPGLSGGFTRPPHPDPPPPGGRGPDGERSPRVTEPPTTDPLPPGGGGPGWGVEAVAPPEAPGSSEPIPTVAEIPVTPEAGPEPAAGILPAVAFVVPPPVEQAIATDDQAGDPPAPASFEPEPTPADPGAIAALGEGLHRKLDALQARFDRETRAEATREKVVDRLHAELQEYKQGLILGILRPVFVDLIQLHDDIGKMADANASEDAGGEAGDGARRLLDLIRSTQQGIEDILYRQGVEPYALEGDAFDPRRQRALATVATDDPGRNKCVVDRLRKGFQSGEKVIRPEMVTVYSFR